jgi:hypothetical protein
MVVKVDMSKYDPYGRSKSAIDSVRKSNDPTRSREEARLKRELARIDEALAIAARLRAMTKNRKEAGLLDKLASCLRRPKKNKVYTC